MALLGAKGDKSRRCSGSERSKQWNGIKVDDETEWSVVTISSWSVRVLVKQLARRRKDGTWQRKRESQEMSRLVGL